MNRRKLHIHSFLERDGCFHFAKKKLISKKPEFLHGHDFYELFLVDGDILHYRPEHIDRFQKGDLVFIRPTDVHALQAQRGSEVEIINLAFPAEVADHINDRYFQDVKDEFFWAQTEAPKSYRLSETDRYHIWSLLLQLSFGQNTLLRLEHVLLSIIKRLIDSAEVISPDCEDRAPAWFAKACVAVRQREVFSTGVSGFVEAAGRGHEHVCRMSKKHLGMSPTEYINKHRMAYAASMLSGSDVPIAEIASQCGINNLSHFYRMFQKYNKMTPKLYRQEFGKDLQRSY